MANHQYIILENYLVNHYKEDDEIFDFFSEIKIDRNNNKSISFNRFREIIRSYSYNIREEIYSDTVEMFIDNKIWFILSKNDDDEEVFMLEIGRGSDFNELINFVKKSEIENAILYCDSGMMSLITPQRDNEVILKEMSYI